MCVPLVVVQYAILLLILYMYHASIMCIVHFPFPLLPTFFFVNSLPFDRVQSYSRQCTREMGRAENKQNATIHAVRCLLCCFFVSPQITVNRALNLDRAVQLSVKMFGLGHSPPREQLTPTPRGRGLYNNISNTGFDLRPTI